MLPLAAMPGSGAELYQGLGVVLTGRLAFSTVVIPTMVPALTGLLQDFSPRNRQPAPQPKSSTAIAL